MIQKTKVKYVILSLKPYGELDNQEQLVQQGSIRLIIDPIDKFEDGFIVGINGMASYAFRYEIIDGQHSIVDNGNPLFAGFELDTTKELELIFLFGSKG